MSRRSASQLNIRSDKARERVDYLVRETGKTKAQIVEDAVMAYRPPPPAERPPLPEGFIYRNGFIVQTNSRPMTVEQHLSAIDDAREERTRQMLGEDVG